MTETHRYADVEFELKMLTPEEATFAYPEKMGEQPLPANTTTIAVATCMTAKGPFVCLLPLDGRLALLERDLAQKLVEVAYDELARAWVAHGYDKT